MHPAIRRIAAEIFEFDPDQITSELTPDNVELWDSLNHLRLITEIETEFDLRLSMDQVRSIDHLGALAALIGEPSPRPGRK